jgi:NADH-quinone oxidoreductase subunit L
MTIPLVLLAVCVLVIGFFGTPAWPWLQTYLGAEHSTEGGSAVPLMILSTVIVAAGIGLGWWLYGRRPITSAEAPDAFERINPEVFGWLRDKFKVDELYEATVIAFNAGWARFCDLLDRWVWGGAVQLVSYGFIGFAWLSRLVDEYVVNLGFDRGCDGIQRGGSNFSRLQNGRAQHYLRALAVAIAVLVLVLAWGWQR